MVFWYFKIPIFYLIAISKIYMKRKAIKTIISLFYTKVTKYKNMWYLCAVNNL